MSARHPYLHLTDASGDVDLGSFMFSAVPQVGQTIMVHPADGLTIWYRVVEISWCAANGRIEPTVCVEEIEE
jgi:hypothetical protein